MINSAASYNTRLGRRMALVAYSPLIISIALFLGVLTFVGVLTQVAEGVVEVWRK